MKKLLFTLIVLTFGFNLSAQETVKKYYDISKTQIMELYHVNASGEKHGSYKGYDQKGIVTVQANYKNGLLDGIRTKYATSSGKQVLAETETYKDNVLHGPAKYYGEGGLILREGEYLNGEKNGKWTIYQMYTNYELSESDQKANAYYKMELFYDNGKQVFPIGESKMTYYPSGNNRGTETRTDSTRSVIFYLPDGKIESEQLFAGDKMLMEKLYHTNGQIKMYRDWRDGFKYEAYDKDGNPDRETLRQGKIQEAVTFFNNREFAKASQLFSDLGETKDAGISKNLADAKKHQESGDYLNAIISIGLASENASNPIITEMSGEIYPKFIEWLDKEAQKYVDNGDADGLLQLLQKPGNIYKDEDFNRYMQMLEDAKSK